MDCANKELVPPHLTVCVIGKNEADHIAALYESLASIKSLKLRTEFLFIDSASEDRSVDIAKTLFDRVIRLAPSNNLCASAGRFVGTRKSRGTWILFLDGDMELCADFLPVIKGVVERDNKLEGWLGQYNCHYYDGTVRRNAHGYRRDGGVVSHFGGAVLLPRDALMTENWNPRIFSNEEIELYCRLRKRGLAVKFRAVPMVKHHTPRFSKLRVLVSNFVPRGSVLGKKFYGIGQVLAGRYYDRDVLNLVKYFPFPFVFWGGLISSVIFQVLGLTAAAVVLLAGVLTFVTISKGFQFISLYLAYSVQALLGWFKYDRGFQPQILDEFGR